MTKENPAYTTCDLSDVVDFIGTDLERGKEVIVVINGVEWKVLPGGPPVMFPYADDALVYDTRKVQVS